jgi:hypothetical protein
MTMDASHLDDDALSAALDGSLEDAAGQSHLAGCATCTARRDYLAAARSALAGALVEPVDELTRRRLIAAAVAEAAPAVTRSRPWYQSPALAGGVAAAILALFAAVPFVTGGRSSTGDQESATAALDAAAGEFLGDLGDLSDPAALRGRFSSQRSLALSEESAKTAGEDGAEAGAGTVAGPEAVSSSPAAGRPAAVPAAPPQPGDSSAQTYDYGQGDAATNRDDSGAGLNRAVADACARTLAGREARGGMLLAVATGTYRGTRAVVAVFGHDDGTTAYVAGRDGCRLLTQYPV